MTIGRQRWLRYLHLPELVDTRWPMRTNWPRSRLCSNPIKI